MEVTVNNEKVSVQLLSVGANLERQCAFVREIPEEEEPVNEFVISNRSIYSLLQRIRKEIESIKK